MKMGGGRHRMELTGAATTTSGLAGPWRAARRIVDGDGVRDD